MGAQLTEKQFERECSYRTSISIMDSLLENGLITKQEYRQIERILAMEPIQSMRKRLRVAAYCRVSCGKDAMLHSLAAQVSYYSELIQHNPEWDYAGVYTDEAQSGTRDTRPEFQRLLNDCRAGKVDRILVKSISRFARNTVTLLETVRELKGLGVSVYFEEQKIDTLSGACEFMLSILASFAQEESRSVSENCKWRVRKKFEQGIPTGFRMYGYEVRNGVFTLIPEEAAVVQRIFHMYLDGMGNMKITKTLIAEGIPAPEGGLWIIDRETFEAVQAEIARRKAIYTARGSKKAAEDYLPEMGDKKLSDFLIGDRICCGICGKQYRRKITRMGTPYAAPVWMCSTFRYRGKAYCASKQIPEKILIDLIVSVLGIGSDLDNPKALERIHHIEMHLGNRVLFVFQDDHTEEHFWKDHSRRDSWDAEKHKQAAEAAENHHQQRKEQTVQ